MKVAQNEDGFDSAPQGCQGFGHPIGRRSIGQALQHHMRGGGAIPETSRDPDQLIPLLPNQRHLSRAVKQRLQLANRDIRGGTIELLIGEITQAGHKRETEQITEGKELFGKPMSIGCNVRVGSSVSFCNKPSSNVEGFARRIGNDLGTQDTELIRDVTIDGEGPLVVAKVAGIEGPQERARLQPEALAIRRRAVATAPHRTQLDFIHRS